MSTADRAATITLFAAAVLSIIAGIVIIVLGHTMTRSRVETSTELLTDNLETAQKVIRALDEHSDQLTTLARLPAETSRAAQPLPDLIQESSDLMRASIDTIRHTAGSLRTFESGADFLTSGSPISNNADSLMTLAERMTTLREVVAETHEPVGRMVQQLQAAVAAQQTLRRALADAGVGPDVMAKRLERTLKLQRRANLPAAAAWQQTAVGAGFLLVGLMLGGVGLIFSRLADRQPSSSLSDTDS